MTGPKPESAAEGTLNAQPNSESASGWKMFASKLLISSAAKGWKMLASKRLIIRAACRKMLASKLLIVGAERLEKC